MKTFILLLVFGFGWSAVGSSNSQTDPVSYKCMVQMVNYTGEKAYLVISLVGPDGNYVQTLDVMGDDEEWYEDILEWWKYFEPSGESVDGISGASIGNGERQITTFEIDPANIGAGYSLRFETAVEDQDYHAVDLEIPLDSATMKAKVEGNGYIRYVRILPQ
ncbi:MAG: DUF2271 domain-containing protein [Bacteroidota bacterium]